MTLDPNTARLIGEIHSDVKHLNKNFEGLGCKENKAQITEIKEKTTEMYGWYSDYKDIRQHIVKKVATWTVCAILSFSCLAGAVYAVVR